MSGINPEDYKRVDPAHAGMILASIGITPEWFCGPRACGDDPMNCAYCHRETEWTPRMRG